MQLGSIRKQRLLGGGGGSGGVDIGADQSLSEDGDQAALGLLALSSTSIDELVGGGRGECGYIWVSELL